MNQEPLDFQEEAYQIEARIIAEYMLAGDKALGEALRDALKANLIQAVKEAWADRALIEAFNQHLRTELVKRAQSMAGKVEQDALNREISAALGKQWASQFKDSVDDAVRQFLKSGGASLTDGQKNAVSKGFEGASLEKILEKAVGSAMETHLQAGLKDAVFKSVKSQLTEQQVRRITSDIVRGDIQKSEKTETVPWFKEPSWLLMAPVALLLILVIWGNRANSVALSKLETSLQSPVSSQVHKPEVEKKSKPDPVVESKPAQAPPKDSATPNPLLKTWLAAVEPDGAEPDGFGFISENPELALEVIFGFKDAKTLKAELANLVGRKKGDLFLDSPLLDMKDSRVLAASLAQKLVREAALARGHEPGWSWLSAKPDNYLADFKGDGDFGAGSIALTNDFLTWLGEAPSSYSLDRTKTPAAEFLLISYLALEALGNQ